MAKFIAYKYRVRQQIMSFRYAFSSSAIFLEIGISILIIILMFKTTQKLLHSTRSSLHRKCYTVGRFILPTNAMRGNKILFI